MALQAVLNETKTLRSRVSSLVAATVMTAGSLVAATPLFMAQPAFADTASTAIAPCTTTATVKTTDLSTWDLSQTRATGHNELVNGGLHVWTEGTTSTDKAAGYYTTSFPLSGLGDQTISQALDYTATTGTAPGLQLVVDFNNDGVNDGILVGERVYGNDWWLSSSTPVWQAQAPNTGGGYGSPWFGTAGEWLAAFPDAQVTAIGYSMGSGVLGNGVINSINLGCTTYTFSTPQVATNKDQCKNGGYQNVVDNDGNHFKNQGQCVSYTNGRGSNQHQNQNVIVKLLNRWF